MLCRALLNLLYVVRSQTRHAIHTQIALNYRGCYYLVHLLNKDHETGLYKL